MAEETVKAEETKVDEAAVSQEVGGKLKFASQEDYEQAVDNAASSGKSEELARLLEKDNIELSGDPRADQPAQGDETSAPEKTEKPVDAKLEGETKSELYSEKVNRISKEQGLDQSLTYQNDEDTIRGAAAKEKYIKTLESKTNKFHETNEEIKRLRAEIEAAKSAKPDAGPAPESKPVVESHPSKTAEIAKLTDEIDKISDEEQLSVNAVKLRNQRDKLLAQELSYKEDVIHGLRTKVEEVEKTATARVDEFIEKSDAKAQTDKFDKQVEAEIDDIGRFQQVPENAEYLTKKPIGQLDKEYVTWGDRLGQSYFGNTYSNDPSQRMMQRKEVIDLYFAKNPMVVEKATTNGIEFPSEMEKYIDIANLLTIQRKFKAADPDFSLQDALNYKVSRNGGNNQKVLDAKNNAAEIAANVAKQDPNLAKQLSEKDGGKQGEASGEISAELALKVMEEVSVEDAARDPAKKELLNKAYLTLGLAPESVPK